MPLATAINALFFVLSMFLNIVLLVMMYFFSFESKPFEWFTFVSRGRGRKKPRCSNFSFSFGNRLSARETKFVF